MPTAERTGGVGVAMGVLDASSTSPAGIRKRTALMVVLAVSLAASLTITATYIDVLLGPRHHYPWRGHELRPFTSREELERFVLGTAREAIPVMEQLLETRAYGDSPSYSRTNVQVEGVDEADVVKTDGRYIYAISRGDTVLIIRAYPPHEADVVARVEAPNLLLTGLFINEDRLVVMGIGLPEEWRIQMGGGGYHRWRDLLIGPLPSSLANTTIMVFDVSDRSSPRPLNHVAISGGYLTSRMIGDYVYVLASSPAIEYERTWTRTRATVVLPKIWVSGRVEEVDATDVYHANVTDRAYAFTTILAMNVRHETREPTRLTLLTGVSACIYVSRDNIYIAMPTMEGRTAIGALTEGRWLEEITYIYRVRVFGGEIACKAHGSVPGRALNQFSMDEHEGYFRIATTKGHAWSGSPVNNIYVLDMDLLPVGALEGIAPGEEIYAARFMGDRCYLVTFKKVDPFFVIDLSDPRRPEVLGFLKITGYSSYLHPYGDDYVIGIGKEAVGAEEGDFAWYQGVKIALFNVSDVGDPKLVGEPFIIGHRGTETPVLWDHKAFLFDPARGLMAMPVLVAMIDKTKYPGGYVPPHASGDYVWQGAYVFNVSTSTGIALLGLITHLNGVFRFDPSYFVVRVLYIGDVLYTVSDEKMEMNSIPTLDEIGWLDLWP